MKKYSVTYFKYLHFMISTAVPAALNAAGRLVPPQVS